MRASPIAAGSVAAASALMMVLAGLAGCLDESAVSTTAAISTISIPVTTTASPTTTLAATTTNAEVWDVVALGDSLVAGWGVRSDEPYTPEEAFPGVYARSLGTALGVQTALHSYYPSQSSNEVRTVEEWNQELAADEAMRSDLAGAEVVIVWLGYHNIVPALLFFECGGGWPDPLRTCLEKATQSMPADFDELLGTIRSLVPEGTVVMIGNQGIATRQVDDWGSEPYWPELKAVAFDGWWAGIEAAAAVHNAIVVDSSTALNGPEGNQELHPEFALADRLHFNSAGHRYLADLFLAADGL